MRSETELIRYLQKRFPARAGVRVGIGDDAAVLRPTAGYDWVVTTDQLIEDVHFLRRAQPARSVGWKALARSLSDIAAMGARPRYALVALALPPKTPTRWVKEFFTGLAALARRHKVQVVGGDLASAQQICADVQVMGEVRRGRFLLRSGARAGQTLYVSGRLGLAALGTLLASKRNARHSSDPALRRALRAHFYPQPRVELAQKLSRLNVTALMDLSDGLSLDLARLCRASGAGARLYAERLPLPKIPPQVLRRAGATALELALSGGEDYELLFTAPKNARLPKRLAGVTLTAIGEIKKTRGIEWVEIDKHGRRHCRPLQPRGWDHFQRRR